MGGVFSADQEPVELVPKQWSQDPQPLGVIAFLPMIPHSEIFQRETVNPSLSWHPTHKNGQEKGSSFCQLNAYWKEPDSSLLL